MSVNLYIVQEAEFNEDGWTSIVWKKRLYLFKEDAFKAADEIGKNAIVWEMSLAESWNWEQRKNAEGFLC